ncbi:MAG TPA: TonB-dependent receptor [Steroidobacteraceae bacterium]|nr:TonB-dependent receptor [Steroidobacteraceae bacterium]
MTLASRVHRFVPSVAAAVAASLGSVAVQAQESAAALQEVTVTARYREENLQTTPLAITAFSGEDIEMRSLKTVDDLGVAIPNAYFRQPVSNFGPTQTIGLRGLIQVDFNYAFEPEVGLYIDDVYHGTLTGSSLDLTDIDRVEVLRGPQGTLFGKNTMGGAIRLISKKPQGDGTGSIEAIYGQRDRVDVRATGDWSIVPDKVFARISAVSRRQDGYGKRLDFTCEMKRRGTPQLAGIGDGLAADGTTGPRDGQPDVVAAGSPADNAFAFPQVIDERQGNGCALGSLGGTSSHGARLALRYIANDRLEYNLAGEFSKQDNEPPIETALTRRGSQTIPPNERDGDSGSALNAAGLPFGYDLRTIYPKWGIRYTADDRFLTGDPYTNYATYGDAVSGISYDPNTHLTVWGVNGTADYSLTDKTHLRFIGAYRTYHTTWINDSDLTPFELIQTNYLQEHRQKQAEVQLSGVTLGDRLDWTAGLFYYDSASRAYNTANFVTFGLTFVADDRFTSKNKSAFTHLSYKLTDSFSISGGVRYTDEDKTNLFQHFGLVPVTNKEFGENRFDYSVSFDWQAADALFLYAQTATGFQSAGITPRVFTVGQIQSLPGEEVTNYELGAKLDLFDRKVRLNSAAFYMDYSKRLVNVTAGQCNPANSLDPGQPFFLAPGTPCPAGTPLAGQNPLTWFYYQNAPGVVKGFESELMAFPLERFAVNASVGYNMFKGDQTDRTAPNFRDSSAVLQPKWNFSAGAQYVFNLGASGRITPRIDWYYQSYRTNGVVTLPQRDPDDRIPGYGLANARVTFDTADANWQIALNVNNLFNKFYWQQLGSATDPRTGFPTAGRVGTASRPREWAVSFKRNFQ